MKSQAPTSIDTLPFWKSQFRIDRKLLKFLEDPQNSDYSGPNINGTKLTVTLVMYLIIKSENYFSPFEEVDFIATLNLNQVPLTGRPLPSQSEILDGYGRPIIVDELQPLVGDSVKVISLSSLQTRK